MEFFAKDGGIFRGAEKVSIKGLNWFGLETEVYGLHGLWSVSMTQLLDFVKANKFNALRIPLSMELIFGLDTLKCTAINTSANPNLVNCTPGKLLDILVAESAKRGILVMPDIHRFVGTGVITELWYNNENPESKMIDAWKIITKRYLNSPNVFAMDIKNEPHGQATWGTGNSATDWNAAATRIGNAILEINPKVLVFVEGVERYNNIGSWWGGSVEGAKDHPITLKVPNKLVYSPHVYGPSVSAQPYFSKPEFPSNLPPIWTRDFGFLKLNKTGTLVLGEWGGHMKKEIKDDVWQNAMGDYIHEHGIDYFYWCLNPNSGDTGGILEDDWKTPIKSKIDLLQRVSPNPSVFTFGNNPTPTPAPKPTPNVSIPIDRGITSRSKTSRTSPAKTPA